MTQALTVPPSLLVGTKRFEFPGSDDTGEAVTVPVLVTFDPR